MQQEIADIVNEYGPWLLLALPFVMYIYVLPAMIASGRNLRDSASISLLNIFMGWTLLGWVGALCWACAGTAPKRTETDPFESIADRLTALTDQGPNNGMATPEGI